MLGVIKGSIEVPYEPRTFKLANKYRYIDKDQNVIYGCKLSKDKKTLSFPRDLVKFTQIAPEIELEDLRITPSVAKKVTLTSLVLREYQQSVAEDLKKLWGNGSTDTIICAAAGWGKTYVLSYFISNLQLRTTIIVDKTLLANQMLKEISEHTDADVAILTKTSELHDVNIVTFQLLNNNPELLKELQDNSGFVVLDECHIAPASSLQEIMRGFSGRYRMGLSATPTRSDNLTELIYDTFGRSIVFGHNPEALVVDVHRVKIPQTFYSGAKDYKKKLSVFLKQQKGIIQEMVSYFVTKGRHVFIAVDTQDLQEFYCKLFNSLEIPSAIMNAYTTSEERNLIIERFNKGELKVIIGFAVLEKGISISRMDTIVHLSGAGTKEKCEQLIGRLRRTHELKRTPMFIDLQFLGNLERQQSVREWTYKKLGNTVRTFMFSSYEKYREKFK